MKSATSKSRKQTVPKATQQKPVLGKNGGGDRALAAVSQGVRDPDNKRDPALKNEQGEQQLMKKGRGLVTGKKDGKNVARNQNTTSIDLTGIRDSGEEKEERPKASKANKSTGKQKKKPTTNNAITPYELTFSIDDEAELIKRHLVTGNEWDELDTNEIMFCDECHEITDVWKRIQLDYESNIITQIHDLNKMLEFWYKIMKGMCKKATKLSHNKKWSTPIFHNISTEENDFAIAEPRKEGEEIHIWPIRHSVSNIWAVVAAVYENGECRYVAEIQASDELEATLALHGLIQSKFGSLGAVKQDTAWHKGQEELVYAVSIMEEILRGAHAPKIMTMRSELTKRIIDTLTIKCWHEVRKINDWNEKGGVQVEISDQIKQAAISKLDTELFELATANLLGIQTIFDTVHFTHASGKWFK